MMTMSVNSWTSFNASIVSAETGDPDNENTGAVLFQQSCPNLTVFVNCLVKLNFTYDKNLDPQTTSSLQISYIIRGVYHESPIQFFFFTQRISTLASRLFQPIWVLLVYIYFMRTASLLHSNVCASALWSTVGRNFQWLLSWLLHK